MTIETLLWASLSAACIGAAVLAHPRHPRRAFHAVVYVRRARTVQELYAAHSFARCVLKWKAA